MLTTHNKCSLKNINEDFLCTLIKDCFKTFIFKAELVENLKKRLKKRIDFFTSKNHLNNECLG